MHTYILHIKTIFTFFLFNRLPLLSPQPMSMDELGLAQFALVSWDSGVNTSLSKRKSETGFRTDSVAFLRFFFERQTGFFLLQVKNGHFPSNDEYLHSESPQGGGRAELQFTIYKCPSVPSPGNALSSFFGVISSRGRGCESIKSDSKNR